MSSYPSNLLFPNCFLSTTITLYLIVVKHILQCCGIIIKDISYYNQDEVFEVKRLHDWFFIQALFNY